MAYLLLTRPGGCVYCTAAKHLLTSKGISFEERNSTETGTYPQIIDKSTDKLLGGYDKLCDRLDEPILDPTLARFTPIPPRHKDIFQMYKQAQSVNWVSEEVDFYQDLNQWKALSAEEQRFLKYILAFFAGADGIVQENLMTNFKTEVQYAEARCFYAQQEYMESVHAETYGKLLMTYIETESEVDHLVHGIQNLPSVRRKAEWSMKWLDSSRPFAQRLLAFICVEGIMFSGSFCAVFWMKQRGQLPALTFSNDLIARDEGLHQRFGELLYTRHLKHRLGPAKAREIVFEAVDTEIQFVSDAIGNMRDAHLDAPRMIQYVKYVADRILITLGYSPIFAEPQPFPWMETISLSSTSNFFEKRVDNYYDSKVGQTDRPAFDRTDMDF